LEPEPTPLDRVKQKRQDDAANQAEAAKTQSIIDAIKTSGGDTKDSVTSAMHDLLLATLVAKDPRLAQVSADLGKLLESIAKASENVSNSGLDVLPKTFGSLVEALKALPAEVAKTDRSPELIPYLQEVTKAVKGVKTVVTPNVVARVDLSSINSLLERVEKAVKDSKVEVPTTDLSAVESAVKSVEKSIKNLSFPVPNYILPFKDPATGKATQVTLTASGEVPISGTISVDTTGLATSAKQDTGNTSLANIDTKTPALGQALAAGSTPVVLTAAQVTTLTPPAAITNYANETGGNLAAVAASASVLDDWDESDRAKVNLIAGQAGIAGGTGVDGATVPRFTLATNVPLPAGTNAIGKLAANSGVIIGAVEQSGSNWSTNLAQIAGNTVSTGVGATGTGVQRIVQANGAGRTLLSTGGSAASSGNNTLVAAGTNRLKVYAFSLSTVSTAAVTCIFQSGAGGTELWRVVLQAPTGVSTGANLVVPVPSFIFATASATLLNLNLSGAQTVHWSVSYFDEA
jgi:hypothetical protein